MERTGGYPEEDLETCTECGGSGVSEECEECQFRDEQDDY
jgi:hypothetical protein